MGKERERRRQRQQRATENTTVKQEEPEGKVEVPEGGRDASQPTEREGAGRGREGAPVTRRQRSGLDAGSRGSRRGRAGGLPSLIPIVTAVTSDDLDYW